jgi:hypothetical protein
VKHKLYYDEDNKLVTMEVCGDYTHEEAKETLTLMRESFADKAPYPFLLDLTELESDLDRQTRRLLQSEADSLGLSRMAMIVTNPVIRMTAKIIASVIGKKDETGFFKTKDEALSWLKGKE